MKLNRTQALFLVGTIAAVGCVVENNDDGSGDKGGGGSSGSGGSKGGSSGSSGASGSSGTYTGGTSTGGAGGEGGSTCMDEAGPQVMCADFMEPGTGAGGEGSGGVGSGGEGYGGAGGVGPSCEGMGDLQSAFCTDLWTNFKPSVANAARTCMNSQTPEQLCTWDVTFSCATEALLGACPDPSADPDCQAITDACSNITAADCSSVLSGMTAAGRTAVVSCAAESTYCNLWVCAGVASPAGE